MGLRRYGDMVTLVTCIFYIGGFLDMKSGSSCLDADAFIILTKQGIVLASGDTRLTQEENRYLQELNQQLIKRKRRENLPDDE